jgi:glycosyltransferase involved in cell wall biosynthesis
MDAIVFLVIVVLGGASLFQLSFVLLYARVMRPSKPTRTALSPKFCIMTAVRGADPKIAAAVQKVLDLDYPDFEWRIVVDHANDPAVAVIESVLAKNPQSRVRVQIEVLEQRPPHRSLLCSSFLQITAGLDDSFELLAFWDGDMLVPPNWLHLMANAIQDPEVGGTLGNRWYAPTQGYWGSLVRYVWNAGAVIPMWVCQIPWSGGLAMRLKDFRRSTLVERWECGFVEDAPVKQALSELGLKMKFVPELLVVNREDITLLGAYRFIKRQLLWTRLYHPHWGFVVLIASALVALVLGPSVLSLVALATGELAAAAVLLAIWIAYSVGQLAMTGMIERSARRMLAESGEYISPWCVSRIARLLIVTPVAQCFYFWACVECYFARHVDWRGVRYEFADGGRVKMLEYQPFGPLQPVANSNLSI